MTTPAVVRFGSYAALLLGAALLSQALTADTPRIVIDGSFDDWSGNIPAAEDPFDGPDVEVDLTRLAVTHDRNAVYFDLEFASEILPQGLTGTATLLFDADGDQATGSTRLGVPGVDVAIVFSPPHPEWTNGSRGVGVRSIGTPGGAPGKTLNSYDLGVMLGPTHSANRFEVRLDRGIALPGTGELFKDASFSVTFAYLDQEGNLVDRSGLLNYSFGQVTIDTQTTVGAPDPLARAADTRFRVLSWNISGEAIFSRVDAFQRILAAIQPDLILLDEVPASVIPEHLFTLVDGVPVPEGASWNSAIGPGGGRQHVVAISRFPVSLAPGLERVPYPDDFPAYLATLGFQDIQDDLRNAATDGVSSAGFIVEIEDRRVLAVSLDLQCCGRLGEPHDRVRLIQAEAVRDAVADALPRLEPDAVIVAGDLNLVGNRQPLNRLKSGIDTDGSDLAILEAIQLDGRSAATWGFSGPFPSSRLDYFLYGDSELMPLNAFVFDARDLEPDWAEAHNLSPQDSRASNHLPIVVDLGWTYDPSD